MFFPTLIQDYLTLTATRVPGKIALICEAEKWSYADLARISDELALYLKNQGLERQDRVVVYLDNSAEVVMSLFGILKAGGIFVIVNGTLKAKKLAYILKDAGAKILITHTSKASVVQEIVETGTQLDAILWAGAQNEIPLNLTAISHSWPAVVSWRLQGSADFIPVTHPWPRNLDVDLAALIYTSGSTGEPKGVMSTHQNMLSAARSIIQYLENTENDVILAVLPLSFDYGLYQALMAVIYGGTVVIEKSFFYMHQILQRVEQYQVTGFPIVPTILAMILKLQDLTKYNFRSLRYISNTGAALPEEHIRKFRQLFPAVKLYSMFGLTECKRVCYLPPEELDRRPGSVGRAIPNCEVMILDDAGQVVPTGEVGELVVRGANVMQGYWNAPDLTAKYFRPGRYPGEMLLYSGDFFRQDEAGFLYFLGRKDDMIKSRGERVSAKEIENLICEIDGVNEVAVVGVPDDILGQAIKAVIVLQPGAQLTEKDILRYCTTNLELFAVPKWVTFVTELPRTANGKIDKRALQMKTDYSDPAVVAAPVFDALPHVTVNSASFITTVSALPSL